jgi:hypothetical protein
MRAGYAEFIERRRHIDGYHGFPPTFIPDFLFPFQQNLVEWATEKGRAAIFADTGLGKTPMEFVWAHNVVKQTNKPVLILTPLAVSGQMIREGLKFGIPVHRSHAGELNYGPAIYVANYERLHYFDREQFGGVVCDESSILKNFKGATKAAVTQFMRKLPYRLLATATASPNDFIELGTSSEALGYLGYVDMLTKFFKNDLNTATSGSRYRGASAKWRFKGHAEEHFWRWVVSWSRAIRRPSDLGYSDEGYILPPLHEREHVIRASNPRSGELFDIPAMNLQEQREERRITLEDRCELVASLLTHDKPAVAWAHLNDEGDLLEQLIPDAKQVKGSQSDEEKEEILRAFADKEFRVLVTKPKITGFGLNWQHAHHMTFFPSHSFEQYYQGVRRMYRFGQTEPVTVEVVTSEGERGVMENLQRKAWQADRMFSELVRLMQHELRIERHNDHTKQTEVPSWL